MSRIGSVLALAVASVAVAQPPTRLDQLGAVVKSQPDFYGAIAGPVETVKIAWTLSAPTVELGGSAVDSAQAQESCRQVGCTARFLAMTVR